MRTEPKRLTARLAFLHLPVAFAAQTSGRQACENTYRTPVES